MLVCGANEEGDYCVLGGVSGAGNVGRRRRWEEKRNAMVGGMSIEAERVTKERLKSTKFLSSIRSVKKIASFLPLKHICTKT